MVTMMQPITREHRFLTSSSPCPICNGYDRMPRGNGERCSGYMNPDGEYVFCTREEKAGSLEQAGNSTPPAYMHKLYGRCNCGVEHRPTRLHQDKPKQRNSNDPVAEYSYHTAEGRLAYQAVRYEPKRFTQRRPDGNGGWLWNMQGVTRVPYHLPGLLRTPLEVPVYIVEGEKDVEALEHLGLVATTNVGGAEKWTDDLSQYLKGRHVVILPDNDVPGQRHATKVEKSLQGIAASVQIINLPDLPEKGDVSDWLELGGTKVQLEQFVRIEKKQEQPTTQPTKRKFLYASDVKPEKTDWLWDKRIARGAFTLLVGDPGLGKSLLTTNLIKETTTGGGMPDSGQIKAGGVVLMAPEDSNSRTIVPRLLAAGADLSKVLLLSEVEETDEEGNTYMRPISFPEDAGILEEAIIDAGAALAIIDPVMSMLSSKYDAHKDQATRLALARVISLAEKHKCAVVGIAHLNKGQSGNALYRSGGSIALIAQARTGLFVVQCPDDPDARVVVNHKNNLAPKAMHLRYTIDENEDEIGYVSWLGQSTYTEQELLSQNTPTDNKKSVQEQDILTILKNNGMAMTIANIVPLTNQSYDALEKMLSRKVKQGILIKPAKGMYTYNGNPLYTAKKDMMSDVSNVSPYVGSVGSVETSYIADSDMSESNNGNKTSCQHALTHSDTSDIKSTSESMSEVPDALRDKVNALKNRMTAKGKRNTNWTLDDHTRYYKRELIDRETYFKRAVDLLVNGTHGEKYDMEEDIEKRLEQLA